MFSAIVWVFDEVVFHVAVVALETDFGRVQEDLFLMLLLLSQLTLRVILQRLVELRLAELQQSFGL